MPGSKRKARSKGKVLRSHRASTSFDPFVSEIDKAEGSWDAIINIFCDRLALPDLTTRKGLKKVHENFDDIYKRLDRLYEMNPTNDRILGAIIGIGAKLCSDSILRDKLFKAGFLSKLMPLLNMPSCRNLALRALMTVTHHGGVEARTEIARHTPSLIKLMEQHPGDPKVAEFVIVTMSHALGAVVGDSEKEPNTNVVKSLDVPNIFKTFIDAIRNPMASHYLITHAFEYLTCTTLHFHKQCTAYPSVLTFLVAALRSKDLIMRSKALGAIIRLHHAEMEEDKVFFDPQKAAIAAQRGYPPHLDARVKSYGRERCDLKVIEKTTADNYNAYLRCARDHNLHALGVSVASFILRTEFSVAHGAFQVQNPQTGAWEMEDIGLPFVFWVDALPHCADAIRARKIASEEDLADVLDLKYAIAQGRIPDAITHAGKAIARNPNHAYFYYALTMGANPTEGLRAAKKGLKCKQITPFVRFALLQRAVDHAADLGLRSLQTAESGSKDWAEGFAFLNSALEDSKAFIDEAPPDTRHMKSVLQFHILLSATLRGPELSKDLNELQAALTKLQETYDFAKHMGMKLPRTQIRLAQETVINLYPAAVKEWSDVIARFDTLSSTNSETPVSTSKPEDDLAAWLEDIHVDDDHEVPRPTRCSHPKLNASHVALYRCSWCNNPSAVLRKCSGCTKARYCDASCQRSHWSEHKALCKSSGSSTTNSSLKAPIVTSSSDADTPSATASSSTSAQASSGLLAFAPNYSLAALD